jgi:hypothetical protein
VEDVVRQGLVGPGVVEGRGEVNLPVEDDQQRPLEAEVAGLETGQSFPPNANFAPNLCHPTKFCVA